jgi:hypothetical protein
MSEPMPSALLWVLKVIVVVFDELGVVFTVSTRTRTECDYRAVVWWAQDHERRA